MKHFLLVNKTIACCCLLLCVASVNAQQQSQASSQKVIKDPAEFNAYIAALNTPDPVKKAAGFEAFFIQYPNSVVRIEALEQLMGAYQQLGNQSKLEDAAKRICELDANNVRALAIITYLNRGRLTQGDTQLAAQTRDYADRGLRALPGWQKPADMSSPDFERLHNQIAEIFYGASGFVALQAKDYVNARNYYLKSVQIDPANLQDVYQLAIAGLEMQPLDVTGFWYIARAINLAEAGNNAAAKQSIMNYGKARYSRYHGSDDGWERLIEQAKTRTSLPQGFSVTTTPSK